MCFYWSLYLLFFYIMYAVWPGFPGGSEVKASASNAGEPGSIPGAGRSPAEGNGNPLQYSCQKNPMDWGAWWAAVHGVTKSRTRLSDFTYLGLKKHFDYESYLFITENMKIQWHPTPVLLPGKSHGWRSLVGCGPLGCKESDTTERLHFTLTNCAIQNNGKVQPLQQMV